MERRKDPKELASLLCEDLAQRIKLKCGDLRLTVSEAKTVKIEARPHVRICCVQLKVNEWTKTDYEGLEMEQAPEFVTEHLEPVIVALVGRFGCLEANLKNGCVTRIVANTAFQTRRRRAAQRSRPRPKIRNRFR